MKKAYLFGAAALLILLIVVAYVSYSRKKKGDVEDGSACVQPTPQVVGPMADRDPVVRTLAETFEMEDVDDTPLALNRPSRKRPVGGPSPAHVLLQSDACVGPDRIDYDSEMQAIIDKVGENTWEYGERDVPREWKTPVT